MKRGVLLIVLVLLYASKTLYAQDSSGLSRPEWPYKRNVAVEIGVPLVIGQRESGHSSNALSLIPNRFISLSANLYHRFSVKGGLWRASFLSPALPEDYDADAFISFGGDPNKVYDVAKGMYALIAYSYYVPLVRTQAVKAGIHIQPGIGIGTTRLEEAQFTPYQSHQTGMGFITYNPTHEYHYVETDHTGVAAQLAILGYIMASKRTLVSLGPTLSTMPGNLERMYSVDIGLGLSFSLESR